MQIYTFEEKTEKNNKKGKTEREMNVCSEREGSINRSTLKLHGKLTLLFDNCKK